MFIRPLQILYTLLHRLKFYVGFKVQEIRSYGNYKKEILRSHDFPLFSAMCCNFPYKSYSYNSNMLLLGDNVATLYRLQGLNHFD